MDEQQFILRLPEPLVEQMRFALSSTKRRDAAGEDRKPSTFAVEFKDERNAVFTVDGTEYPASLMDLPTLVETHKTADKRTYYKSGDLHQVLLVRMPGDPPPEGTVLPDGLTAAAKDARRRLAPPKRLFSSKQVESVEHRVKYVIDHKVKIVPKKDRPEDRPPQQPDDMEVVIEEETTVNVNPTPEKPDKAARQKPDQSTPQQQPTPMQEKPPLQSMPESAKPPIPPSAPPVQSPADPKPLPDTPQPSTPALTADTPAPFTPAPLTPAPLTPAPETPAPGGETGDDGGDDDDDDDEEDDDDFAEMAGALMADDEEEARKRIERANLDQKITEQKAKITQLEERAAKAPNPVLRTRILSKRGDLQETLDSLEKQRAELGDV